MKLADKEQIKQRENFIQERLLVAKKLLENTNDLEKKEKLLELQSNLLHIFSNIKWVTSKKRIETILWLMLQTNNIVFIDDQKLFVSKSSVRLLNEKIDFILANKELFINKMYEDNHTLFIK